MNTGKRVDTTAQCDTIDPTEANPKGNKHGNEIYQHPQHTS